MLFSHFCGAVNWLMCLSLVAAGLTPINSNLQIRNAPGKSASDTLRTISRSLHSVVTAKRDTVFKNSTTLDRSWKDAVLFKYEVASKSGSGKTTTAVEIVCTTCYIKGTAAAQFTISGNFNASQAFQNVTSQVKAEFENITSTAVTYVENYFTNLSLSDELHINNLDLPPLPIDFNLDIPNIPECELRFQFDGLELYMAIDTILSGGSTYIINLYTSESAIGFAIGKDLLVGVVFTVDVILSVESQIDISSGFHILLNDGIAIDIHMFDKNVSSITFNGGNFEFLPVTIQTAGVVLTALLRVGIKAGLKVGTPPEKIGKFDVGFSAGIEAGVYVDVAHFTTNVTANPAGGDGSCDLSVVEAYSMLLGANAGASVVVGSHQWGPTPETQIPIWYTTLLSVCATTKSPSTTANSAVASTTAKVARRAATTTATTVTIITYTATACLSTSLINCPASLQTISKTSVTSTLTTTVPSGSNPTFPTTTKNVAISTIAFGNNAKDIQASSGSPVSYVPKPTSGISGGITETGVNKKVAIGVSVGVAVLVLLIIAVVGSYCYKRKMSARVQNVEQSYVTVQTPDMTTPMSDTFSKRSPQVTAVENWQPIRN